MKVTVRGRATLAAAVALAFSALLFQDILVLTVLLVLIAITAGDAVWVWLVTRRPSRWFSISKQDALESGPLLISKILYPGQNSHDDLRMLKRVGGEAALVSKIPSLKISPDRFKTSGAATKVDADFKTPFAGRYSTDALQLVVSGPLRLVSGTCALRAKLNYSVFPHVLGAATTSTKVLGKGGAGEATVESLGVGTEFYGIGEYQSGESYRHINWKATARRGKLMTNELMKETGGSYYLVLEAVSPDYFDRDRLASAFLGMANTLAMHGIRFGVVVHDGENVKQVGRIGAPAVSLAFALKAALEFAELERAILEEELSPASSRALRPVRAVLAEFESSALYQIEDMAILQKRMSLQRQDVTRTILELVRENPADLPSVVYVSGLFGPTAPVIELGISVRRTYRADFLVVNPTAPWIPCSDEDEAYDAYLSRSKKLKALRSAGVDYRVGEPSILVQGLLSAQP